MARRMRRKACSACGEWFANSARQSDLTMAVFVAEINPN